MKDQKSEVENVIKSLTDFEKHLDEIKEKSIERKENLIKITETEVEKIKDEISSGILPDPSEKQDDGGF